MILPEGYFYRQWIPFSKSAIIKMLISLILTILAIKIWMMDEKKKSIVRKEEYYPPNKMNTFCFANYIFYGRQTRKTTKSGRYLKVLRGLQNPARRGTSNAYVAS